MEKLIVKNFGAIRELEINLNNLTIFIGETGTGKSTLAKLISIFRSADFWLSPLDFLANLRYYQINDFLRVSTFIEYQSEMGIFTYNRDESDRHFSEAVFSELRKIARNLRLKNTDITGKILRQKEQEQEDEINSLLIAKELVETICDEVIYIPAERGVVSFLSQQYGKELTNIVPDTLLNFIKHFNIASSNIRKLPIDLFGVSYWDDHIFEFSYRQFDVTYQKENGKYYIVLSNGNKLLLAESASGMQTIIPAILIFEYHVQYDKKKSYTFEEPELNLFPIAQKSLIELLAERVLNNGHKMVITTHSPYILTALNNLLYAHQVGQKEPSKVEKLVKHELWMNPQDVGSYLVEDGTTRSIMDDERQQIKAEEIDEVSNLVNSLYDSLLEIEVSGEDDDM